jgi:hypothetical protein
MPVRAINHPADRSIPLVKITRVCPIASVPTTITCWTIKEKLLPVRKRFVRVAKKIQVSSNASKGPMAGFDRRLEMRIFFIGLPWNLDGGIHPDDAYRHPEFIYIIIT